ncbi:hypothetical protein O181_089376 [Austropuccinia psidii MF-1]|uniref:Uncharacterized protein n=1 Tax=Austropuccinia psidii MF-1 TaxID=1389203 RepID=A0A9Q3ITG9_9BASI|nr:hypothetical protein [Austropuccinia psidii MF-1]
MDLIRVQDAEMQKAKPARGKGYTAGSSCITNILINNREAKIHLDSGAFCTCVGKDYLDKIYTNWQDNLMPTEGIKFSSSSQNMHPLGIFEAEMIFPPPTGSICHMVECDLELASINWSFNSFNSLLARVPFAEVWQTAL